VHKYHPTSSGDGTAIHETRDVSHRSLSPGAISQQPPLYGISESSSTVDGLALQHPRPQQLNAPSLLSLPNSALDPSSSPQSAPATLFPSYADFNRPRDVFNSAPATATAPTFAGRSGTSTQPLPQLPTFPNRRGSDEDDSSAAWQRDHQERRGHRRVSSDRRNYPLNAGDDDREESISLVHNPSLDELVDTDDDDSLRRGGIRLVAPSSGNRF